MGKLRISRQRKAPIEGPVTLSYSHNADPRHPTSNVSCFGVAIGVKAHPEDKMTFHTMTLTRPEVERAVLMMTEFLVDPHNTSPRNASELFKLLDGYMKTSNEMNVIKAYQRPRRDVSGRLKIAG